MQKNITLKFVTVSMETDILDLKQKLHVSFWKEIHVLDQDPSVIRSSAILSLSQQPEGKSTLYLLQQKVAIRE